MTETEDISAYACLTVDEANRRLAQYGLNAVEEEKRNPLTDFLKRFWGPIPWMLEIAAILELVVGKDVEAAVIIALLIFNSVMSFLHEGKAQKALELLKQRLAVKARVMRDNKWMMLDAKFLVPDDLVHLRLGDFVPADIKILDSQLQLDQSALTGESLPIEAETGSVAYSGSVVKRGEATGIVVGTGKNSYFGKTAELVKIAKTKSNLSRLIFKIVKYLLYLDFALSIFFLGYVGLVDMHILSGHFSIVSAVVFVLVILIAAIPIALPATYTLSTALGAVELSKLGVLTTKLSAIEESAAMTVLCSDKTGTLTENKVQLEDVTPVGDSDRARLLTYAVMASDARSQDALDDAIFKVATPEKVAEEGRRVSFTPFDPAIKRTESVYEVNGETITVFKGQPRTIWSLTGDAPYPHEETERQLASKGERVLAVGCRRGDVTTFLGFLGFMDPERADSRPLVEELRKLGIRVIMLTGDTAITARTIAGRLGIGDRVCDRAELLELAKTDAGKRGLADYDVFGGIYPEDKYNIVKALQDADYIVGMTGDGVNDSPALKAAEVGIAVAGSTDVAKAAASVVLTDPGLADIVAAIKTSREIFQRMATWILNKIAKTIEISFFTILGVVFTKSFIITPMLVILLLFTNDFVTMSISTDNVKFSQEPNNWKVKNMIMGSVPMGLLQLLFSFGALLYLEKIHPLPLGQIQTIVFLIMVFTGQGVLYLVRTGGHFYSLAPSKYMLLATLGDFVVVSLMASFGILMPKIPYTYVLDLLAISAVYLFFIDYIKIWLFRKFDVRP
jgi:H+-transporting ATPase